MPNGAIGWAIAFGHRPSSRHHTASGNLPETAPDGCPEGDDDTGDSCPFFRTCLHPSLSMRRITSLTFTGPVYLLTSVAPRSCKTFSPRGHIFVRPTEITRTGSAVRRGHRTDMPRIRGQISPAADHNVAGVILDSPIVMAAESTFAGLCPHEASIA